MTLLIAHAGHWLVQVAYLLPVLAFLVWLGITTVRERRAERTRGENGHGRSDSRWWTRADR